MSSVYFFVRLKTADKVRVIDWNSDLVSSDQWKTPRGDLQAIHSPNLSRALALTEGEFPTALLDNRALVADSRNLSPRLSRTMEAKLPDGGHIHDRMRRVLAYWGDRDRADTAVLADR